MAKKLTTFNQDSPYSSPWQFKQKVMMLLWEWTWLLLCRWTPKPFNFWRVFILKLFGAKIFGKPFVHQRAVIAIPWNLSMHHKACLGDGAYAYSLGEIEIMDDATVAQQAYLCTGTHDFSHPSRALQVGKILIGKSCFIGARAFVMPNVTVFDGAIVGACSVVTKDVPKNSKVAGNPAKLI